MCEGISLQIHAPVTGSVRRPTVESLTAGTNRLSVVEDRSLCWDRQAVNMFSTFDVEYYYYYYYYYYSAADCIVGGWVKEVSAVCIRQQTRYWGSHDSHRGSEFTRPVRHQEQKIPDLQDVGNQGRWSRWGYGMVGTSL